MEHVNHLDLVGWINPARYKWAEMMGKDIKFRPATFYLGIADMLAGSVDGVVREGEAEAEGAADGDDGDRGTKVGRGVEVAEDAHGVGAGVSGGGASGLDASGQIRVETGKEKERAQAKDDDEQPTAAQQDMAESLVAAGAVVEGGASKRTKKL